MSNFSFGALANTTGVASDKRLKPYSINKVKFTEAKSDVLHSEKTSTDYKVLKVRFDGEGGYYEENYFLPSVSGQDVERTPNNWGGENPSNADRAMMFFAHILGVLNPAGLAKLKKVVGQMKNFEQLADAVAKLANEKKGTECYLKLTGRANAEGNVFASLPYFCSISKDSGDAYVSNNFLSLKEDGLSFTASEEKKRQSYANAKPTSMKSDPSLDTVSSEASGDNSDIDSATQDDLLASLDSL